MGIEQKINYQLNKYPTIRKAYHRTMYAFSHKIKAEGNPDRARIQEIRLMDGDERKGKVQMIARVFAPQ